MLFKVVFVNFHLKFEFEIRLRYVIQTVKLILNNLKFYSLSLNSNQVMDEKMEQLKRRKTTGFDQNKGKEDSILFNVCEYI